MSLPKEETDNSTDTPLKSSSRKGKLTEKGQEMHNQDIKKVKKHLLTLTDAVSLQKEPILCNSSTTPEIVKKMDACVMLTKEIYNLISNHAQTVNENYDQLVKERVRENVQKDDQRSVFGRTKTETVSSQSSERLNNGKP